VRSDLEKLLMVVHGHGVGDQQWVRDMIEGVTDPDILQEGSSLKHVITCYKLATVLDLRRLPHRIDLFNRCRPVSDAR
jgi:hypothetical protein